MMKRTKEDKKIETKKYESGHYHTQALFLDNIITMMLMVIYM